MPRIDFLILANHAEVRDGLLNMLGGGWNQHARTVRPDGSVPTSHFGIAIGIAFDKEDMTRQADLWIGIRSDEGTELVRVEGGVAVSEQTTPFTKLVILAFNVDTQWPRAGTYHLVGGFGATQEPERRFTFGVVDRQSA
jgi:hypothetical protein